MRVNHIYRTGHVFPPVEQASNPSKRAAICFYELNICNPIQRDSLTMCLHCCIGFNDLPQWRLLVPCHVSILFCKSHVMNRKAKEFSPACSIKTQGAQKARVLCPSGVCSSVLLRFNTYSITKWGSPKAPAHQTQTQSQTLGLLLSVHNCLVLLEDKGRLG